jgi:dUTP pyrophosphatase
MIGSIMVKIKIKRLREDAILPRYAHFGDAGMDVFSCENLIIPAKERRIVSTGIAAEFPSGYVALVWDKSGLASNFGLKTLGGVIDSSYRGEYKIIILNTSSEDYEVKKGEKIAQILIQPVESCEIEEVTELEESSRGEGRFGSTGKI